MPGISQEEMRRVLAEVYEATTETRLKVSAKIVEVQGDPEAAVRLMARMVEIVALAKALDTACGTCDPFKVRSARIAMVVALTEFGL